MAITTTTGERVRIPVLFNDDGDEEACRCDDVHITVYCEACGDTHWRVSCVGRFMYVRCWTCGLEVTNSIMRANGET